MNKKAKHGLSLKKLSSLNENKKIRSFDTEIIFLVTPNLICKEKLKEILENT
jgi:hypothetical protein